MIISSIVNPRIFQWSEIIDSRANNHWWRYILTFFFLLLQVVIDNFFQPCDPGKEAEEYDSYQPLI